MRNRKTKNGLRRNHVVQIISQPVFPARIWKVLDDETVIVICCGFHVDQYNINEIEKIDYKGWWNRNHFIGMSRLRSLKKGARKYNPNLIPTNTEEFNDWINGEENE